MQWDANSMAIQELNSHRWYLNWVNVWWEVKGLIACVCACVCVCLWLRVCLCLCVCIHLSLWVEVGRCVGWRQAAGPSIHPRKPILVPHRSEQNTSKARCRTHSRAPYLQPTMNHNNVLLLLLVAKCILVKSLRLPVYYQNHGLVHSGGCRLLSNVVSGYACEERPNIVCQRCTYVFVYIFIFVWSLSVYLYPTFILYFPACTVECVYRIYSRMRVPYVQ